MSGFVPSASNPEEPAVNGGVPVPPPPPNGPPVPPAAPAAPAGFPQQPQAPVPAAGNFGGGGDDWGNAATPPAGPGDDDNGGRKVSPVLIIILAILGVALIGFGAYTFLGKSSEPTPAPAPTPTQTTPAPPAMKPVPSVIGFTIQEATKNIEGNGFVVGEVTEQPSDIQPGTVTAQDPASGIEAPAGAIINLVVATAQTPGIPDVEGMNKTDATNTLIGAGFEIGKVTEKNSSKAKGTVLDQSPDAGKKAKPGTKVSLTVSTGKIKVPDVIGYKEQKATATLENAGFKVKVQDAKKGKVGTVTYQSPKPGAMKEKGTVIVISVVPKVL